MKVAKDYHFVDENGANVPFSSLFDGKEQLVIQHMMFEDSNEKACPMCCSWTEQYSSVIPMLETHAKYVVTAAANIDKLKKFKEMKGWQKVPFYSVGANSEFHRDFGVSFNEEEIRSEPKLYNYGKSPAFAKELFGFSVFKKEGSDIFHTYSTYSAGLAELNTCLKFFDILPGDEIFICCSNFVKKIQ